MVYKDRPDWTAEQELTSEDKKFLKNEGYTSIEQDGKEIFYSQELSFPGTVAFDYEKGRVEIRAPLNRSDEIDTAIEHFDADTYEGVPVDQDTNAEFDLIEDIMETNNSPK